MQELIWKYLVGPIIADAQNAEKIAWNSITAYPGYNPVNTAFYALTALTLLYGAYRILQDQKLARSTAIYSLPFIFLGGSLRFLEDAAAIQYPYSILLVTPLIYILIAAIYVPAVRYLKEQQILGLGLVLLTPSLTASVLQFKELNLFYIVATLAASITPVIAYQWLREEESEKYILGIILSQFFEGAASMNAAFYGYKPKQLLAQAFNSVFGPPGILILKIGVAALAVDIVKDLEDETLAFLALIVIYSVGFGTGFRVFLRALAGI